MEPKQTPKPAPPASKGERMTGSLALIRSLENMGVEVVFGLPGGAILPTYDPLMDSKMRHILVRHEQGAGHAAEGYALATGKVGVCIVTSGPGATNLITALADANMDSVPMVAITGQVGVDSIGTDAFQESDILGATLPLTKHSFLVTDAKDVASTVAEAFHIASTGRPGPVLIDFTKTAQAGMVDFQWPPKIDLPGYRPAGDPHPKQIKEAAKAIAAAERPVLYVGGGVIRSNASAELKEFAELSGVPVVTTLTARGAFPDSHPLHYGMPGMHGTVAAVTALQRADLLITLGARFDDRVTGKLDSFAPRAKVIHVDIDAAEISKNRIADIPIVGDVKPTLVALSKAYQDAQNQQGERSLKGWYSYLDSLRDSYPLGWTETQDGMLAPQYVISRLNELVGPEAVYCAGVGQHQMWAAQFIKYERPRSYISSCGLGTMGVAIPEAMGAKVGCPDRTVWAIDGDGCFQMTNQELATCFINNIPIKVALINNSSLGMVRQWQTLFYNERYSNTELNTGLETVRIPDFQKLAEAYGAEAILVEKEEEVDDAIKRAMEINDRPVLVEFIVSKDAMVWPMVPAGVSNDQIQHARGLTPDWKEVD